MRWTYRSQPRKLRGFSKLAGTGALLIVLLGGVTYAALQSQEAKLTGNTIQTASANLQISTDGTTYSNSISGFSFIGLVPGGSPVPAAGRSIFLKNFGSTAVALKIFVSGNPLSEDGADPSKVHVILTPTNGGSVQSFTLGSLIASSTTGGQPILAPAQLAANTSQEYKLQVSMDTDAFSGPGATINNVDFSFTGTAVTQ